MPRKKTLLTTKEINDYRNAFNAEHYVTLRANAPKDERLPELIEIAVSKGISRSKQAFILEAIREHLKRNEISIDMLAK